MAPARLTRTRGATRPGARSERLRRRKPANLWSTRTCGSSAPANRTAPVTAGPRPASSGSRRRSSWHASSGRSKLRRRCQSAHCAVASSVLEGCFVARLVEQDLTAELAASKVLEHFVDTDDREGFDAKFVLDLGERGAFARAPFLPIDGDHEPREFDRRGRPEQRYGLAGRGPRRGHVLDDQDARAVAEGSADERATLAVVLGFFPVEAEADMVAAPLERDGRRHDQGDPLV